MEVTLPELCKALKYKDEGGKYWYPNSVVLEDKSWYRDWKWSAVQSKDGKPDMTTKKEYPERKFMDALEYIGYFNQK